jgi:hypothetical protein
MNHRASVATAVSAPGKVLLTGGYLVLDRNYTGTVIALDARIHVIVQQLKRDPRRGSGQLFTSPADIATEAVGEEEQDTGTDDLVEDYPEESIFVRSPQFLNAVWEYGVRRCDDGGGVKVTQRNDGWVELLSFDPNVPLSTVTVAVAQKRADRFCPGSDKQLQLTSLKQTAKSVCRDIPELCPDLYWIRGRFPRLRISIHHHPCRQ